MGSHEAHVTAPMPPPRGKPRQPKANCRRVVISCRWVHYSTADLRTDLGEIYKALSQVGKIVES